MSIKKELLDELSEKQLKEFADNKSIDFSLSSSQKKYYADWTKKDRLVDIINDNLDVTVNEIEEFIKTLQKQIKIE